MLRCALSVEKPELEDKRAELLRKEEQLKSKLFVLQDSILIELANAQGNVLDNKVNLIHINVRSNFDHDNHRLKSTIFRNY